MKYFHEISHLPKYDLMNDLFRLIETGSIKWTNGNQICINTTEDDIDNYLKGTGSLLYKWNEYKSIIDENNNEKLIVPENQTPLKEKNFKTLCRQFNGTVFEDLYLQLIRHYSVGRVRLMKLPPKTCLTWHTDSTPRIHYPVKTQEGCFMVINDEVRHLDQETWWIADTTRPHTAFNSSKEDRIHLVAVILDS